MIHHSFCHMTGVGLKTEKRLWDEGVVGWRECLDAPRLPVKGRRAETLRRESEESLRRLEARDADWFYQRLPSAQQWRLFEAFRDAAAYFDIETTGLGGPGDYVTTIGLYDGARLRWYVQRGNLFDFLKDIGGFRLVVSYNGKGFDAPFLREAMGARLPEAHVDLRHVLASLGYSGGLKHCERRLGLDRGDLAEIDGQFAVLLWFDYLNNDNERALDTLLAYNLTDVVNLEPLAVAACDMKRDATPFAQERCAPVGEPPEIPFLAHDATIRRLRASAWQARSF